MKNLMLLLILIAVLALSSNRCTTAQPIYDTEGREVTIGQPYHIIPASQGLDAGFGLSSLRGSYRCPMRVVLQRHDQLSQPLGIPVVIAPWSRQDPLHLSTDVEINFHNRKFFPDCEEIPREWHLRRREVVDWQWHVAAGRMDSVGGHLEWSRVFRIERHHGTPKGYKIMSCVGWPEDGQRCHDLGLHIDLNEVMWLVVSNKPYVVVFQKYTGI